MPAFFLFGDRMGNMIFPTMGGAGVALYWAHRAGVAARYHRLGIAAYALQFDTERDRARFVKFAQDILKTLPASPALDQIREAIAR
jgi:hypothetical protein